MLKQIHEEAVQAALELCEAAKLKSGQIVIIGCSSSEIGGAKIGSNSSTEIADAVFSGLYSVFKSKGIWLAAQCCEHLNRAVIIERAAAVTEEPVNVIPQPKAGGSFATAAYHAFEDPVALEEIRADAGIDIGSTLIGMHLKRVAVPLRLSVKTIGAAPVTAARTRPKFIGGVRAVYDQEML